ncbi:MAG: hypothetical protein H6624_05220 [Bdellovibrionaceae bacterium]|nr:hypothetical protein [Bdellovibrionales bacterium]MCB9083719.1 hypothetical protein [Pseudobdellovibrionaceae bacterium]
MSPKKCSIIIIQVLPALALAGLFGCSDVRLFQKESFIAASEDGLVCTQTPNYLENLNRVIFITDMSQSMEGVDPHNATTGTTRRVAGLRKLVDEYKDDDNFTITLGALHQDVFGFLPDASTNPPTLPQLRTACQFLKSRVDTDYNQLQKAMNQMDTLSNPHLGNSPFKAILENTKRCIEDDLATNTSGRYSVVIVTDGAPTDVTPKELSDKVVELIHTGKVNPKDPVEASRVNVYFYFMDNFNGNPDGGLMMHRAVLAAQAAGGFGSRSIVADDTGPVDYNAVGIFANRKYVLRHFAAVNMNGAISSSGALATDSDSDGLPDAEEIALGLNPLIHSTHKDCSDKIWLKNGGFCPAACIEGMAYLDSDQDGLSDCDDLSLSTDPYNFDRDGDLIFDGLEFRIGSNPLDPRDATADMGTDGLTSFEESIRHTGVFMNDREVKHGPLIDVSVQEAPPQNGQRCYRVSLKNVPLFPTGDPGAETMLPLRHEAGGNVIKLMFFQVLEDNPSAPPVLLYAHRTLYYEDFDQGTGSIGSFLSRDFQIFNPDHP